MDYEETCNDMEVETRNEEKGRGEEDNLRYYKQKQVETRNQIARKRLGRKRTRL